jgi:hypothetical protein
MGAAEMIHEYTEPFFHVGLICRSVDRVAAELSARFGIGFHEPQLFEIPRVDDGRPRQVNVRACFSLVGPPHIELFEADGVGIYKVDNEAQFHHIGLWVPNCAAALERARRQGLSPAAVLGDGGSNTPFWFTDPQNTLGIRFEMIDDADRANMETFIRTGVYPGQFQL